MRRAENVVTRELAGEIVLVPIKQATADFQQVHLLNNTAAAVWQLLDKPRTPDEVVSLLAERFDVPRQAIADDVNELLADLGSRELVEWVGADE
ncbi:MAG TPA: PqqD family protein [Armatimonadota bacterium]|nr:PqqD family protein [Armatimonadota bacterium]